MDPNGLIQAFWKAQNDFISVSEKHAMPLARIKKVMKLDPDLKPMMISNETAIILSKACELFILELTLRAWQETDALKRKTMQKSELILACSKCDMYDFLIDIIQREEVLDSNGQLNVSSLDMNNSSGLDLSGIDMLHGNNMEDVPLISTENYGASNYPSQDLAGRQVLLAGIQQDLEKEIKQENTLEEE